MFIKKNIYDILVRLTNSTLPQSYRKKILFWFVDKKNSEDKDEALYKLWNETDSSAVTQEEIHKSLSDVKNKIEKYDISSRRKTIYFSLLKYAAILLFPIISGLTVWYIMKNNYHDSLKMIECFVPKGEKKCITLCDGTQVFLNSGTLFIYPEKFMDNERRVFLSGEAFFDVTHDDTSPFIVRTGRLNIKVLGTRFNLEAYPDDKFISTTLNKGSVKVYSSDSDSDGVILKPDERLIYNTDNKQFELNKVESEDYSVWIGGELRFIRQPLSKVFRTLERKYNIEFRLDDNINLNELYTANFKSDETIEQVVNVLISIIDDDLNYFIDREIVYINKEEKGGSQK